MAVKIRLKRMGKIRAPFYRVVVMDSRTKRDGRAIEEIGKYHPTHEPSIIEIDSERAQYWLTNGAQPTEATLALLKVTGDWQRFRGEEGAEGSLKVAEPKKSKKDLYEAAVAAAGGATLDVKDTPARKKAAPAKRAAAQESPAPSQDTGDTGETGDAPGTGDAGATPEETAPAADTDSGAASVSGNPAEDPDPAPGTPASGDEG